MNGPHDMGGMQCYGPVVPERDEPVFHHDWEKRALALTVAMGATGAWNLDMSRQARESLDPVRYLSLSYYEIWLAALEELMIERGLATETEMRGGRLETEPVELPRVPDAAAMKAALAKGAAVDRPADRDPLFKPGQAVHTRNVSPQTHTRLPRYARDKDGLIEAVNGCHIFPDSHAVGRGEDPHWLYTVRFEARELFGGDSDHTVLVDCWEPYLEPR